MTASPCARRRPERASALEKMEKIFIIAALQRHGWNRRNPAKEPGIHRSTLRRKMKALGIEVPEKGETEE